MGLQDGAGTHGEVWGPTCACRGWWQQQCHGHTAGSGCSGTSPDPIQSDPVLHRLPWDGQMDTQSSARVAGGKPSSPASHQARQGCSTGKTRGQIEAAIPVFVLASPEARCCQRALRSRTALLVTSWRAGRTHGAAESSRAELHTPDPTGRSPLGLGGTCWKSIRGNQPQNEAEGFFYLVIQ